MTNRAPFVHTSPWHVERGGIRIESCARRFVQCPWLAERYSSKLTWCRWWGWSRRSDSPVYWCSWWRRRDEAVGGRLVAVVAAWSFSRQTLARCPAQREVSILPTIGHDNVPWGRGRSLVGIGTPLDHASRFSIPLLNVCAQTSSGCVVATVLFAYNLAAATARVDICFVLHYAHCRCRLRRYSEEVVVVRRRVWEKDDQRCEVLDNSHSRSQSLLIRVTVDQVGA